MIYEHVGPQPEIQESGFKKLASEVELPASCWLYSTGGTSSPSPVLDNFGIHFRKAS